MCFGMVFKNDYGRANDLQEHLIQRKFRELGLGNGTPPLHNTDAGELLFRMS